MWPVMTRDGKGIMIDLRQLVLIERKERALIFHSRTDEYIRVTSIEMMADAMQYVGFKRLDQSNVVNLANIKKYDMWNRIVYFDDEITPKSKRVYVSRGNVPFINQYISEHPEISVIYHTGI